MGKKDGLNKKRKRTAEEEEEFENPLEADPELEAELAAVLSIRAEKDGSENSASQQHQQQQQQQQQQYHRDGLLKCLQDYETIELPFIQTLEINEFEFPHTNELDDMEREMHFYNHAIMAVKSGTSQLESLGVPIFRPHDYFCEHVKSDAHMARIKDRLLMEEKHIEAFEKRKNREQSRKFNKQLSLVKKTERSREEKQFTSEIDAVKRSKDSNKDERLERILNSGNQNGAGRGGSGSAQRGAGGRNLDDRPQQGTKRKAMDKKYGFGGREKKRAKLNDTKSFNDSRDFNPRGGKIIQRVLPKGHGGRGGAAGGKGKGAKFNRPGKDSRAKARSGRNKK